MKNQACTYSEIYKRAAIQKWKQRIDLKKKLGTEGENYFCFDIAIIIFIIILILIIMVIITWNTLQPEEEHEELVQMKIKWVSRMVTWELKMTFTTL